MLVYPSKVRNDIDIALCQRPADIPLEQWTPNRQFQAMMEKLRASYAPRKETNTTTLRCQLQELSDNIEGGSCVCHTIPILGVGKKWLCDLVELKILK
jgi:hypothetical protein